MPCHVRLPSSAGGEVPLLGFTAAGAGRAFAATALAAGDRDSNFDNRFSSSATFRARLWFCSWIWSDCVLRSDNSSATAAELMLTIATADKSVPLQRAIPAAPTPTILRPSCRIHARIFAPLKPEQSGSRRADRAMSRFIPPQPSQAQQSARERLGHKSP